MGEGAGTMDGEGDPIRWEASTKVDCDEEVKRWGGFSAGVDELEPFA